MYLLINLSFKYNISADLSVYLSSYLLIKIFNFISVDLPIYLSIYLLDYLAINAFISQLIYVYHYLYIRI